MIQANLKHTMNQLAADVALLPAEMQAAGIRAANRTMTTVRAEGARSLKDELPGLLIGAIKKRLKQIRATPATLSAAVVFSASRFRLINWKLKPRGAGVSLPRGLKNVIVQETWSGNSRVVPAASLAQGAFLQVSRLNNPRNLQNIWRREGKERYPLLLILAPSLAETLKQSRLDDVLVRRMHGRFSEVFAQEARFRISRRR